MEGIGSRLGRASSRYASVSGPYFKGPVRKWKRGWVCSQPNNIPVAGSGRLRPRHHHQQRLPENEKPAIMLCLWTRLSDQPEPTTKRKFRYTPVVVLEEKKKKKKEAAAKGNGKAKGKEVKEFKPVTREDMLMDSDDENEFEEKAEDQDYFAKLNLNLR